MKTFQVVLTNCDILQVAAASAERNGPYLCFYDTLDPSDSNAKVLAEFREWAGWNELEKVEVTTDALTARTLDEFTEALERNSGSIL